MAATTSGTKTVTKGVAPHLSATVLSTLLAIPLENLTVGQFNQVNDALQRVSKGEDATQLLGTLFV